MKSTHILAMTTAALLVTGSAFAGPNCKKCPNKDSEGSAEGVYEVADREEGEAKPERRERGERPEGDRKRPERRDHSPLRGLDLTEDQQAQVKEIMGAAREQSAEIMKDAKAKKEAGEEVDRAAVRAQLMEIRKAAMTKVYDDVLTEAQQAELDKRREAMEKRRAERESEGGERGERGERPERKGKGESKDRGGDDGLDL